MTFWIEEFWSSVYLDSPAVTVPEVIGIGPAEIGRVPVSVIMAVAPRIEFFRDDQEQIEYAADDPERDVAAQLIDVAKKVGNHRLQPDFVT
jgi:hypothetical protein